MPVSVKVDLAALASQLKASEPVQAFLACCKARHVQPILVGGAVRDFIRFSTLSTDLDWVVPLAEAKPLAEAMAKAIQGRCICLDETFGIYRVIVLPEGSPVFDIAGCIGPDIHADLLRRDLTVNAMAYDLATDQLIDPTHGLADLENRQIKMIRPENLIDDPLRLLRIFRFAAELDAQIDAETLAVVSQHGHLLLQVAWERIQYEWLRLLSAETAYPAVRAMADTGLLERLFPELSAMHGIPGNQYHHLPLFDHTLELLKQVELHFSDLPDLLQAQLKMTLSPFSNRSAVLRLACLFHDAEKPATMAYEAQTDRYRFYGHDAVSADITWGIARRFGWGKALREAVTRLVRFHLYPADIVKPNVTTKARRKFFNRIGSDMPELIALSIADRYSAQGPAITPMELEVYKADMLALWHDYLAYAEAQAQRPARLLSGEDVMAALDLSPGPKVGQLLMALDEAYLAGDVTDRKVALQWILQRHLNLDND